MCISLHDVNSSDGSDEQTHQNGLADAILEAGAEMQRQRRGTAGACRAEGVQTNKATHGANVAELVERVAPKGRKPRKAIRDINSARNWWSVSGSNR